MKFLVVDDDVDNRFLLSKTLIRKFPNAVLVECRSAEAAINILRNEALDLVVAHRSFEADGPELIRLLHDAAPHVPIVAISSVDNATPTVAAGAARFRLLDEWLLLGNTAVELLQPNSNGARREAIC